MAYTWKETDPLDDPNGYVLMVSIYKASTTISEVKSRYLEFDGEIEIQEALVNLEEKFLFVLAFDGSKLQILTFTYATSFIFSITAHEQYYFDTSGIKYHSLSILLEGSAIYAAMCEKN